MARDPTGHWVVVYDGDCGFCKWLLAYLLAWDRQLRLRPVALGTPEADALLAELTPAERNASWHLIDPAGIRRSGGAALAPLLRLLPRGRAPAALLGAVPGVADRGYRWVAGHRSQLSKAVPGPVKRRAGRAVRARESLLARPDDRSAQATRRAP